MKTKYEFRELRSGITLIAFLGLMLAPLPVRADGDLDGDGIPNVVDLDIDGDGLVNTIDDNMDGGIATTGPYAGQYIGDHVDDDSPAEADMDDDGLDDDSLGETDIDGDTRDDNDSNEDDTDGDDRKDDDASETDIDGDGRLDDDGEDKLLEDDDIDGDGLTDDDINEDDIDGDVVDDSDDDDIDGDDRGNSTDLDDDTDGDGTANSDDDDTDGDSIDDRDDDDDDNDGNTDEDDQDHIGDDDEEEVSISLTATSNAPAGSTVLAEYQKLATGKVSLEIDADDLDAGTYSVVVNGAVLGPLVVSLDDGDTEGEADFETNPNDDGELPLTSDPAGLPIEITKDGVSYFTGTIPTAPAGA
jgi:hypothetical protein